MTITGPFARAYEPERMGPESPSRSRRLEPSQGRLRSMRLHPGCQIAPRKPCQMAANLTKVHGFSTTRFVRDKGTYLGQNGVQTLEIRGKCGLARHGCSHSLETPECP